MNVSVPPGRACSPAGAGVSELVPAGFGVHAASRSANATGSAAIRRCFSTRPPPRAETLAHALRTDDLFVEFNELGGHVRPVVFGGSPRAGLAQALAEGGFADEALDRSGERIRVFRLDEEAGDVSLYDTLVAMDVARDHGEAGGHRLEQHDPEGLLSRRRGAEDIGGLVKPRLVDVVDPAREEHVAEAVRPDEPPHLAQLRTRAAEDETQLGELRLEPGVRAEQIHRALARLDAPDEEDVRLAVLVFGERLGVRVEGDVDAVRDDSIVAREIGRDEVPRRARHGDPRVQPPHVALADDAPGPIREREAAEGMEGGDVRAPRRIKDLHR